MPGLRKDPCRRPPPYIASRRLNAVSSLKDGSTTGPAGDPQMRHLRRAWAAALQAFQGRTVNRFVAAVPADHPKLTRHQAFYVAISRAPGAIRVARNRAATIAARDMRVGESANPRPKSRWNRGRNRLTSTSACSDAALLWARNWHPADQKPPPPDPASPRSRPRQRTYQQRKRGQEGSDRRRCPPGRT